MMLGIHPLAWIRDANYIIAIAGGVLISVSLRKILVKMPRTFFLFDAIGIGLYTILGTQKSLAADVNPLAAVLLGMFSAVMGGVIRDMLLNDLPLIFRKEIYATACLAGGAVYVLLLRAGLEENMAAFSGIGVVIAIRAIAVLRNWFLPQIGDGEKKSD